MTKEELIENLREKYEVKYLFDTLDLFFESNVCIPKGENRHPYAVVANSRIHGIYNNRILEHCSLILDEASYRIKPSEPIYEWQWKYLDDNTKLWTYSKYMTKEEFEKFEYCAINIAIADEETRKVRQ